MSQVISGALLFVATGGLFVAIVYVRAGIRAQREAVAMLARTRRTYMELARALYGERARAMVTLPQSGERVSLKCRVYGDKPHWPCSGTTDDADPVPCECWCHVLDPRGPITV